MKVKLLVFFIISVACHTGCFFYVTQLALEKEESEWVAEHIEFQSQEIKMTKGTEIPLVVEVSEPEPIESGSIQGRFYGYDQSIDFGIIYICIVLSVIVHSIAFYTLSRQKGVQPVGAGQPDNPPVKL